LRLNAAPLATCRSERGRSTDIPSLWRNQGRIAAQLHLQIIRQSVELNSGVGLSFTRIKAGPTAAPGSHNAKEFESINQIFTSVICVGSGIIPLLWLNIKEALTLFCWGKYHIGSAELCVAVDVVEAVPTLAIAALL